MSTKFWHPKYAQHWNVMNSALQDFENEIKKIVDDKEILDKVNESLKFLNQVTLDCTRKIVSYNEIVGEKND